MGEVKPFATITINMTTKRVEKVEGGKHREGTPDDSIEVDLEHQTGTNPGTGCPAWIWIGGVRYKI